MWKLCNSSAPASPPDVRRGYASPEQYEKENGARPPVWPLAETGRAEPEPGA
jgi:hypothetical protein